MKAVVRYFVSPDVDLENFRPDDPENFSFLLEAIVGPSDGEGEELLQLNVCTLASLTSTVSSDRIVFGRSLVIVGTSKISEILGAVRSAIERVEAESWAQAASRLSRLGFYEFEDYE
ncbi:Imm8 family immunity protein [Lentzea sp. BCCO 10_0061]|uniref:Imm8 family immunity protein n=1 Tax=Lentzea sokolovensis TaxID=3095429 RepID=A0ABU4VDI6_9PSEU|nr:Imm8 family immunity protein [Lentzea sp. BCCO 10_0061]MDX8149505.1 Imm8 family immunity protein [Lentzea sp. BCCO 10_0061]